MGKIIVALMILFLIFLFFQGFSAFEDFLAHGEGGQEDQPAVLGMLPPWKLAEPLQLAIQAVGIT